MSDFTSTVYLCGIRLDAIDGEGLIQRIETARVERQKLLILNHNLHSLYLYETSPEFRESYKKASCVYIDGMPVIWLARAAGLPFTRDQRITFLDSFEMILKTATTRGWRVFYLGSAPETLQLGIERLRAAHAGILLEGRSGYLGPDFAQAPEAIAQINAFAPDLLFVGMGMPLQETFLARYFSELHITAALTSGATLDYVAGTAYKPPAWAGPLGLYGICRMFHDPRRLWKRYLLEPVLLLGRLGHRIIRQRRAMQHLP